MQIEKHNSFYEILQIITIITTSLAKKLKKRVIKGSFTTCTSVRTKEQDIQLNFVRCTSINQEGHSELSMLEVLA
jgi:hypothetical protein